MKTHSSLTVAAVVSVVLLAMLLLTGCDRVTMENYNRIKQDMPYTDVEHILGKPDNASGIDVGVFSGSYATWKGREGTIRIQFLNGRVKAKEFFPSKR